MRKKVRFLAQQEAYVGRVSRKSRNLFGPKKPFVKLRPAYPVKLVFSNIAKGIKNNTTAVPYLETPFL